MSACNELLKEVRLSLHKKHLPLYAVFVDMKSAFDTAPRDLVLMKLGRLGVGQKCLGILAAILQENPITLDDGVQELSPFCQTTGYPQGDNLSPLLFATLLSDLPSHLRDLHSTVGIQLYADDVVLYSRIRRDLNSALRSLTRYCQANCLQINVQKTKAMKFRRGGALSSSDRLSVDGSELEFVSCFTYLGVEFSSRGTCFGKHIAERTSKSISAMNSIPDPQKLSVSTALTLFNIKVAPVATYGITLVWGDLTTGQLEELDKIKATYLKRVLGLPRNARNRLVYPLAGTSTFIEDIVNRFQLAITPSLVSFRENFDRKMREIPREFYTTPAMTSVNWMGPLNQKLRHLMTRYAIHGFHYKLCERTHFHTPDTECVCRLCGRECSLYHFSACPDKPTLNDLARTEQV